MEYTKKTAAFHRYVHASRSAWSDGGPSSSSKVTVATHSNVFKFVITSSWRAKTKAPVLRVHMSLQAGRGPVDALTKQSHAGVAL